jgi:hypothetical protein
MFFRRIKQVSLSIAVCASTFIAANDYTIVCYKGQEARHIVPFVASLFCTSYAEYPYLYQGTQEISEGYFNNWVLPTKDSIIAVAYYDNKPVGFMSAGAFVDFDKHFVGSVETFKSAGLKPEEYFYATDCIIVPEHRKAKLVSKFAPVIMQHAVAAGYTYGCMVTESHETHPLKPKNYQELDGMLQRFGCRKTDLAVRFTWETIQPDGSVRDEEHVLTYWIKKLQ